MPFNLLANFDILLSVSNYYKSGLCVCLSSQEEEDGKDKRPRMHNCMLMGSGCICFISFSSSAMAYLDMVSIKSGIMICSCGSWWSLVVIVYNGKRVSVCQTAKSSFPKKYYYNSW